MCLKCDDPCATSDPCSTQLDNSNVCRSTFDPNNERRAGGAAMPSCGGYTCTCNGEGFVTPYGAQSCYYCEDVCLSEDPCLTRVNSENTVGASSPLSPPLQIELSQV